jgi:Dimerisation domain
MSAPADATDRAAAFALLDLVQGSVITQALYVAARLGIADIVSEEPLTAAEIAKRASANPEAVYRLLRLLSGYSVFAEDEDDRFGLTPMADAHISKRFRPAVTPICSSTRCTTSARSRFASSLRISGARSVPADRFS